MVEETLAALRKRLEKQQQDKARGVKDAATTTTTTLAPPPPPPPPSVTSSKASKKPQNTSVLIKRKAKYKSKRTRHANNSSLQESIRKQVKDQEKTQDYCRHCNPRTEEGGGGGGGRGQRKASNATEERRHREKQDKRDKIMWKHGIRDQGSEESDSSQDCLCHNICRPFCACDPPEVRSRIIWKPGKRGHRIDELSHTSEYCLCHGDGCLRCVGCLPVQETHGRQGKRGHSKREESDSSCHSNARKTHRRMRSRTKQKQTGREEARKDTRRKSTERRERYADGHVEIRNTSKTDAGGVDRQTIREDLSPHTCRESRERQERRDQGAGGVCREMVKDNTGGTSGERYRRDKSSGGVCNKEQCKGRKEATTHHHRLPLDVDSQGYAQPTYTSRLKTHHTHPKKEKENLTPYIPCGAKSHSYHIGIIAQQEMGRLLSQPVQEHTHTRTQGSSSQQGGAATHLTEERVRQAMANIHHHLRGHTEQ